MSQPGLTAGARVYLVTVAGLALGVAGLLWVFDGRVAAGPITFLALAGLGMVAHAFPIRASRHQAYQVTLPFIVIAAAICNVPQLIAFLILIHAAEQIRVRRPLYIQAFNLCDHFLSAAAAAVFYERALALMPATTLSTVEAAMAAGCTFVVLNRVLLIGVLWTARGLSPARSGLLRPELLAADLIIIWMSGPMLVLTTQAGPLMMLVTAGPLFLARPALAALLAERDQPAPEARANAA
ncbi:MAG: hypothetical protein M3077_05585 [Candidatus Dormibacteraeota bacterium]|nr:hypothetical protein [Candidatus Dormibacteraeota bacterium]